MYALTYSDVGGKTLVVIHEGRGLFFGSMKAALQYESEVFVPHIENKLKRGEIVKKGVFRDVYKPLTQEKIRLYTQIINTLSVKKVSNITYAKKK